MVLACGAVSALRCCAPPIETLAMLNKLTLSEHFALTQAKIPHATGALSTILNRLSLAGRMIAAEIMRSGFVGNLGLTGETNVQGEEVRALDQISNDVFLKIFDKMDAVAGLASEEMDEIHLFDGPNEGKYILTYDPLDGSGNVDVNGGMGTIFSVHRRKTEKGDPTHADFLQRGTEQVAAGYVLYGPSTMFVYTAGDGVHGFTLDRPVGTFFLTHQDIKIPKGSGTYSVNEANESKWDDKTREMVAKFRRGETACGKRSARYAGALVTDFHRTLLKGGIYMYPGLTDKPEGKLRLLYENSPLAMVAEHAGGAASTGTQDVLDVDPTKLHQRTPLYIGAKEDVEEAVSMLS